MKRTSGSLIIWLLMLFLFTSVIRGCGPSSQSAESNKFQYSDFIHEVERNNIKNILFTSEGAVTGELSQPVNGKKLFATEISPSPSMDFIEGMRKAIIDKNPEAKVEFKIAQQGGYFYLLMSFAPLIFMIAIFVFIGRQMRNQGNGLMSFGKSKAKLSSNPQKVTFADVAGQDEAKEELQEIVEFLKEPARFQKLGGKIPKGVILMGPPGTGKTLLARAVAGEANVPFFSLSGSDFVEMFVGVGASRVRDLFEQGKKNAPCIVFIDEIDAVGRHRGAGLGGGHDEREQTLNALLVEMDGFESNEGVILVAATNRPDVLDPALLRPGRFDRRVVVNKPDLRGREGILVVHTKKIPLSDETRLKLSEIARGTAGFTGADLANLVNEAALNAARYARTMVEMIDFEFAKDKVLMGGERRSMVIGDKEKRTTAIHEAGHALLATILPNAEPLHKVTIIPRGLALGLTQQLPIDEKHNYSKPYIEDMIAVLLGGRIAEEITNGIVTTGASNDLDRVTDLARKMVCEWGMSQEMGPLTFGKKEEQIFLGREIAQHQDYSEDTAVRIDKKVKEIADKEYLRAKQLLLIYKPYLEQITEELLKKETLTGDEVRAIINAPKTETQA
ncbi:MAG: ATP-dependent zinc metalloprotease FtsH [bacterium]|nr:ATP-dependent zinc metalloprotease FtsH [bacterium]